MYKLSLLLWVFCLFSQGAQASEIRVASVLNFVAPLEEIAPLFEKQTGHKLLIYSRTMGKTSTKTEDNHELDIILFSDIKSAQTLEKNGGIVKGSRSTYALGKLALWSNKPNLVDTRGEVLKTGKFSHLALPNPQSNAYGFAAKEVLEHFGILSTLEPQLVLADNIVDSRQQVIDNKAELAFTALSVINLQKKLEGSLWIVPKKLHSPLEQQAVILKNSENSEVAQEFLNYMKVGPARNIIEKYGYSLP